MDLKPVEIVQDLIIGIPMVVKFTSIETNGNAHVLFTCNTFYLTKGTAIEIASSIYIIRGVSDNESITIVSNIAPDISNSVTLEPLKFFHGSIEQTNTELKGQSDMSSKTPMCYLKRTFRERVMKSDSSIDREIEVNLFFLTQADFPQWRTDDHDKYAIYPMRNVMNAFVSYLMKNSQIAPLPEFDVIDRIKFGVVSEKGVNKSYFNDNLSGVELSISIPIRKNYQCKC
jgi:hypothetical protein